MSTALLDVNVLIALFDVHHQYHGIASDWLMRFIIQGNNWATCPITQNGLLRIMANPSYPNHVNVIDIKEKLRKAVIHPSHQFWADDLDLATCPFIDWNSIQGHKQLTDIYLLGLAITHQGIFVTFDHKIQTNALKQFSDHHLVVLE